MVMSLTETRRLHVVHIPLQAYNGQPSWRYARNHCQLTLRSLHQSLPYTPEHSVNKMSFFGYALWNASCCPTEPE